MKKKVIIGFLGTQLDGGSGSARWEKWRPSVALAQHEDLVVDRFELLYSVPAQALARQLKDDIGAVSPGTVVQAHELPLRDAWDFEDVYGCLFDFARRYPFDTDNEDYWIHITTGTHVVQICLFLMTEARYFPGCLLQSSPPRRQGHRSPGNYTLIDLDLSRYDLIAQRFSHARTEGVALLKSGIATRNARFNGMI
jgi:transcriptional regulatory protein RtcR